MIGNNVTPFLDELTANESAKSQNPTQRILWPWTKFDHIKIRKTHPSTCLDFQKISPKEECLCTEYIYIYEIYVPPIFTWPFGRGMAGRRLFEGLYLSFVVGLNQTGHEQTMKTTGIQ
jgi:hypothetical protein